jgi:Sugar-transfer associated ATP-grasp
MNIHTKAIQIFGTLKKWFLSHAEIWAYDLVGMPMAMARLFTFNQPTTNNAEFIHRFYAKAFWRLPFGPLRAVVTITIWPLALIVAIAIFTFWNGAATAKRTGTSTTKQILMQCASAFKHSIAPFWFYMFELYAGKNESEFLLAHETIGPAFTALQPSNPNDNMPDKVWFAAHCRLHNIRAVPVLLYLSAGKILPALSQETELPQIDLFIKPRQGNGGHNAERWDYVGNLIYKNSKGEKLSKDAVLQRFLHQSLKDDFIIQPRLVNHTALADISNDALSTVRVFTIRNEQGTPEATNVAFRMAIGTNSVVDNFHQGGLAAAVDMVSGEIQSASDIGLKPQMGWRNIHPVSGVQFKGRKLPHWQDVLALAVKAHAAFPNRIMVGWDVAMLQDGPMIIEGNGKPDLDIHQRVERAPLGNARIAELVVFNLRQQMQRTTG